jgi:hypothetical protein
MRGVSRTRCAGVVRRRAQMRLACSERQAGVTRQWWGLRFIVLIG